jgi:hypothetical protein
MLPREPNNDRSEHSCCDRITASDPQFTGGWIGQELKLGHACPEIVEYGNAAFEQGATVKRGLDPPLVAVEKARAEREFQVGDRLRHDWLCDGKLFGRFRHTARLREGNQNLELAQLETTSQTVDSAPPTLTTR